MNKTLFILIILSFYLRSSISITVTNISILNVSSHSISLKVTFDQETKSSIIYQDVGKTSERLLVESKEKKQLHYFELFRLLSFTNYTLTIYSHSHLSYQVFVQTLQEELIVQQINATVEYGHSSVPLWFIVWWSTIRSHPAGRDTPILAFNSNAQCVYYSQIQPGAATDGIITGFGWDKNPITNEYAFDNRKSIVKQSANGTLTGRIDICSANHECIYDPDNYDQVMTLVHNCNYLWNSTNDNNIIPDNNTQTDDSLLLVNFYLNDTTYLGSVHEHDVPFELRVPIFSDMNDFNNPLACAIPVNSTLSRDDWDHPNSYDFGSKYGYNYNLWGNRHLRTLFLTSLDNKKILYKVGGNFSDFTLQNEETDQWSNSHDARFYRYKNQDPHTIIITFHDDGVIGQVTYGREIELNLKTMTLRTIHLYNLTITNENGTFYCFHDFLGGMVNINDDQVAVLYSWCYQDGDYGTPDTQGNGQKSYIVQYRRKPFVLFGEKEFVMSFNLHNTSAINPPRGLFRVKIYDNVNGEIKV